LLEKEPTVHPSAGYYAQCFDKLYQAATPSPTDRSLDAEDDQAAAGGVEEEEEHMQYPLLQCGHAMRSTSHGRARWRGEGQHLRGAYFSYSFSSNPFYMSYIDDRLEMFRTY
jgi:hypothetical protein